MALHRTANGKVIDTDALRQKNETTVAVGNANTNARGDLLGKGGVIIKKREEIANEFYAQQVDTKLPTE